MNEPRDHFDKFYFVPTLHQRRSEHSHRDGFNTAEWGNINWRTIGQSQYLAMSMLGAAQKELLESTSPATTNWSPGCWAEADQRGKLEITPRLAVAGGQRAPGGGAGNQKANAAKLVIIYSIYA